MFKLGELNKNQVNYIIKDHINNGKLFIYEFIKKNVHEVYIDAYFNGTVSYISIVIKNPLNLNCIFISYDNDFKIQLRFTDTMPYLSVNINDLTEGLLVQALPYSGDDDYDDYITNR